MKMEKDILEGKMHRSHGYTRCHDSNFRCIDVHLLALAMLSRLLVGLRYLPTCEVHNANSEIRVLAAINLK